MKIVISTDIQTEEIRKFLRELASHGNTFSSYNSILVKINPEKLLNITAPGIQILKDDLYHIRRIYQDIAVYKSLNVTRVDAVVGTYLANIRRGIPVKNMFVPPNTDHDDLHIHSSNVALLSIYQAEHLGLGNALLHDIGLAALLHDAGKTVLPKRLIEKKNLLNAKDWAVMKQHTLYGAALLSSLSKIPAAAITVAYEHHMKFDGTGYPETRRRTKKQHFMSQIVAIADFYCTLSSGLYNRNLLRDSAIMALVAEKAGKDFHPLLAANFIQALGEQQNENISGFEENKGEP